MPVDTPSPEYEAALPRWQRCRDCFEGNDAVKARTTAYLPALEGHQGSAEKYDAYLTRAVFYNATARTVAGLLGSVFRATPSWTFPAAIEDDLTDVTLIGNIQRSLGAIADLSGVAALAQRVAPVAAMAAGGMGTVTAPTLFLAGEAGPEQFAFSGADRRFGNGTRDGRREASDLGALRQELADLKRIMERGQDELPFRMSRAIRDAMAETV